MRILFDLGHPADVHFFRNAMKRLEEEGHSLLITTRRKEFNEYLLEKYGFRYELLGTNKPGLFMKAVNMVLFDIKMLKLAKRFKPDIFVSPASPYAAQVARIMGIPNIAFFDEEHKSIEKKLTLPFTDHIYTPTSYKLDFGSKHSRYRGFDELSYLHPNIFSPDPKVLEELGVREDEPFIILRFVSWGASHDVGAQGIDVSTEEKVRAFINSLEKYGKVFITTEKPIPGTEEHAITVPPEKIHSVMHYASLYLGEGATMAAEAAVMGTPSIYINTLPVGYLDSLRDNYGLVITCADEGEALEKTKELFKDPNLKATWRAKQKKALDDSDDITELIVRVVKEHGKP
ncbi:MAG: DUF354 domain-containing protein [Candidatus Thermoplasmatota archaeon]|nr:DUF354 domain-containing protein [Candidatus Thermoplasmatota archaeon]